MTHKEDQSKPKSYLDLLVQAKGPKSFNERMAEAESSIRDSVLSYVSREELPLPDALSI